MGISCFFLQKGPVNESKLAGTTISADELFFGDGHNC